MEGVVMRMARVLAVFLFVAAIPASGLAQDTGNVVPKKAVSDPQEVLKYFKRNWALIIGIDDYQSAKHLEYAVRDAKAVRNLIVSSYGFNPRNVIELYNRQATRDSILQAFENLTRFTTPYDKVFIFYAGHGITLSLPENRERGYILPVDGDPSRPIVSAISTEQLNEYSQSIPAKHLYFVVDACYGGMIFTRSEPISADLNNFLEVISNRRTRQAITAGGRDQTVFDMGPDGHSIFTFNFLQALKTGEADLDKNGVITASEIASYLLPRVSAESHGQQTPQYGILVGDRGGEFFFLPRPRVAVITVNSKPADAGVFVNGTVVGKTPMDYDAYDFNPINIEVKKDGFLDFRQYEEIKDQSVVIDATLEPAASLEIASTPSGAEVFIKDQPVGKTPLVLPKLKREIHQVKLKLQDFKDFSTVVDLSHSYHVKLDARLERMQGVLSTTGESGNVVMTVRGQGIKKEFSSLPVKDIRIGYGMYEIRVAKEGYTDYSNSVEVNKPELTIPITLDPKSKQTSVVFSALMFGGGQYYMGRTASAIAFFTGGLVTTAGLIYSYSRYNGFNSDYVGYRDRYNASVTPADIAANYTLMTQNYDDMKKYRSSALVLGSIAGVLYVYNLVDAILYQPEPLYGASALALGVTAGGVTFSYRF